jgi:aldose 1-epimerase
MAMQTRSVIGGLVFLGITLWAVVGNSSLLAQDPGTANVTTKEFGQMPTGEKVHLYELTCNRLRASVTNYGAILVDLEAPDRQGKLADINLGFDTLEEYLKGNPLFGATVGRYANRIANAAFTLDGVEYKITKNAGKNHIHGGGKGRFDKVLWQGRPLQTKESAGVEFQFLSKDGVEGFPGNLNCTVTYMLTNENELRIDYKATTDKPTIINLTNHSYFNLAGAGHGDVLGHEMYINADFYTPGDTQLIPSGEILSVKGTPLDFTVPKSIGARITQLTQTRGYDHNYVLKHRAGELVLAARIYEPASGRVMEVYTTEPGMQLYTANGMRNKRGKDGKVYNSYYGFCVETQHYPDSPNKPHFPSPILRPGQVFQSTTIFKFSAR